MAGRLRFTVYLTGEDGSTACLLAGTEPTAAEAALIENLEAWEGEEGPALEPTSPGPALGVSGPEPPVESDRPQARSPGGPIPSVPPPPRSGPGSSKKAWADYADALGVTVPAGADRDRIIAAVEDHLEF